MANTLTSLIPDVYKALDVVSRELVGFIPACTRDSTVDRVALNQTFRSPVAPVNSAGATITPAMTLPSAADQTIGNKSFTISKSRYFPFSWSGEEQYSVNQGPGYLTIQQDQIAQALRAATNEVEVDIAVALAAGASRAYGTANTNPFASNLSDPAQIKKILDDNGAPASDRHLVIGTTAGAALRSLAQLTKVNEAGDASMLRQGLLLNLMNFSVRESAQVQSTTAGTGVNYTTSAAGHSLGATTINVITGTGTFVAGDVITIASENAAHKYVVTTGFAGDGTGTIVIGQPGLRVAIAASARTITIATTSSRNMAFSRNAVVLGTRLPVIPANGDMATDRVTITDPVSNLSFELAYYPGYRMGVYHLSLNWGVTVIKPEHAAVLLGAA